MSDFYTALFKVCVYLFLRAERSINLPRCYKAPAVFTSVVIIFSIQYLIWLQLMIVLLFELDIIMSLSCGQTTYNQKIFPWEFLSVGL